MSNVRADSRIPARRTLPATVGPLQHRTLRPVLERAAREGLPTT